MNVLTRYESCKKPMLVINECKTVGQTVTGYLRASLHFVKPQYRYAPLPNPASTIVIYVQIERCS